MRAKPFLVKSNYVSATGAEVVQKLARPVAGGERHNNRDSRFIPVTPKNHFALGIFTH
jgi:hypothetical protein